MSTLILSKENIIHPHTFLIFYMEKMAHTCQPIIQDIFQSFTTDDKYLNGNKYTRTIYLHLGKTKKTVSKPEAVNLKCINNTLHLVSFVQYLLRLKIHDTDVNIMIIKNVFFTPKHTVFIQILKAIGTQILDFKRCTMVVNLTHFNMTLFNHLTFLDLTHK